MGSISGSRRFAVSPELARQRRDDPGLVLPLMQAAGDLAPSVRLRPTRAEDADFMFDLYASTRAAELDRTGWDDTTKLGFLQMQFAAQSAYYARQFATAHFDIIEADGQPVGRLYVLRNQAEIRIIDVTLLPSWRNRGIGTRLIRAILERGAPVCDPLRSQSSGRSAYRLYVRLGSRESRATMSTCVCDTMRSRQMTQIADITIATSAGNASSTPSGIVSPCRGTADHGTARTEATPRCSGCCHAGEHGAKSPDPPRVRQSASPLT